MTGPAAPFGPWSPDVHPVERTNSGRAIVPIASIKPGTRHRRDMGDIDALARSIADVGLLHPVVINKEGVLIAGERRLGDVHGQFCTLCWWCCGDCQYGRRRTRDTRNMCAFVPSFSTSEGGNER
jgi:ParB family chromosome partitioning protein